MIGRMIMLGAALVTCGQAPAASAPLSTADLAAAVATFLKPRADKFTPNPTQEAILGRAVRATARFPELTDAGGPRMGRRGGWTYDPNEQALTLTPWIDMLVGGDLTSDPTLKGVDKRFEGFSIKASGHYVGQSTQGNAFGTTVKVDEYLGAALSVGAFEQGWSEHVFPDRGGTADDPRTVQIAPADARLLVSHLRLFVEGIVVPYAGQKAIACGEEVAPATFERHREQLLQTCVVSMRIDSYGIEDDRDGHVIARWNPAAT